MKSKRRALADYIAKFGTYPCGCVVKPDGSNTQFSKADRRKTGRPIWRLRCLDHNREFAREGMFLLRLERSWMQ